MDEPCPARAMNNGNMGGHINVHPGRPLLMVQDQMREFLP